MASAPEEDNPKETTQPEIFPHPTEIHGGQGAEPDDPGDDHDCGDDVDDRAIQIAARAGLTLFVGARFYTCGPEPCAVEYSGVPGERRGRVETGTEVTVLEYKVHVRRGYSYVAVRVNSNFGDGYGWFNICSEWGRYSVAYVRASSSQSSVVGSKRAILTSPSTLGTD